MFTESGLAATRAVPVGGEHASKGCFHCLINPLNVRHPLDKLNYNTIGVCDLEEPLTLGFSLYRGGDRHAFCLQSRVFTIDVIYHERDQQTVRPMPADVGWFEAF